MMKPPPAPMRVPYVPTTRPNRTNPSNANQESIISPDLPAWWLVNAQRLQDHQHGDYYSYPPEDSPEAGVRGAWHEPCAYSRSKEDEQSRGYRNEWVYIAVGV